MRVSRAVQIGAYVGTCSGIVLAGLLSGCGGGSPATTNQSSSNAPPPTKVDAAPAPAPAAAPAPLNADAEYDKGAALAAAGKLDDARASFAAAAKADPQHSAIAAALAMLRDVDENRLPREAAQQLFRAMEHANAKRWAEAHADVDAAIASAPKHVRTHTTKAAILIEQGKLEDALKIANQVVELDPSFAEGHFNRGAIAAELGRHDAAIADYNRAIALDPNFADAYRNRGSTYTFKNDANAAMADYTKAHELHPRAVEPLYLRGQLQALLGKWKEASEDYSAAIERDPNHAESYYERGLAFQNLHGNERAIAFLHGDVVEPPGDRGGFAVHGPFDGHRDVIQSQKAGQAIPRDVVAEQILEVDLGMFRVDLENRLLDIHVLYLGVMCQTPVGHRHPSSLRCTLRDRLGLENLRREQELLHLLRREDGRRRIRNRLTGRRLARRLVRRSFSGGGSFSEGGRRRREEGHNHDRRCPQS